MGLWEQLPSKIRRNGEQVLWEGAAAVMTAAVVNGESHEIDAAGVDLGFLVLTDQRLIVGHRRKLRKPEVWDAFHVADLRVIDHPQGVAFEVTAFGPISLVVCAPSRRLAELRAAVSSVT